MWTYRSLSKFPSVDYSATWCLEDEGSLPAIEELKNPKNNNIKMIIIKKDKYNS